MSLKSALYLELGRLKRVHVFVVRLDLQVLVDLRVHVSVKLFQQRLAELGRDLLVLLLDLFKERLDQVFKEFLARPRAFIQTPPTTSLRRRIQREGEAAKRPYLKQRVELAGSHWHRRQCRLRKALRRCVDDQKLARIARKLPQTQTKANQTHPPVSRSLALSIVSSPRDTRGKSRLAYLDRRERRHLCSEDWHVAVQV